MTHYARGYEESTDLIHCACGATVRMHYPDDPNAVTWSEGPGVTCPGCMPEALRVLFKACNDSQTGWTDSFLQSTELRKALSIRLNNALMAVQDNKPKDAQLHIEACLEAIGGR